MPPNLHTRSHKRAPSCWSLPAAVLCSILPSPRDRPSPLLLTPPTTRCPVPRAPRLSKTMVTRSPNRSGSRLAPTPTRAPGRWSGRAPRRNRRQPTATSTRARWQPESPCGTSAPSSSTTTAPGASAQPRCLCVRGLGGAPSPRDPSGVELRVPRASSLRGPVLPELQRACFGAGRGPRAACGGVA